MELKDFVRILFEKPEEWKKMKQNEKVKFFFMTQRFMSIAYPMQAQMFNHIKIPQAEVLDYWHESMMKLFKKVPSWIYTSTKKGKKASKKDKPSEEATMIYLKKMNMTQKDLAEAYSMFGESVYEPIKRIEKSMEE